MTEQSLLLTLSEQAVDDSYSLASLLRKCVLLGARTGSELLREWAQRELNGYVPNDDLPSYRRKSLPLLRDTSSGNYFSKREQFHRLDVPADLRDGVPEEVHFRQSIDELESMARASKPPSIGLETFPLVASMWSQKLPMFQSINRIYYQPGTATFVAMVGAVRTRLVEIIADLLRDVPMDQLPSKRQVDDAVTQRIYNVAGDLNEVSVGSNSGAVGAGRESVQTVNTGTLPGDLAELFDAMRALVEQVERDEDRADLAGAVDDFEDAVAEPEPDERRVRSRARALGRLAQSVGTVALTAAASDLTTAGLSAAGLS